MLSMILLYLRWLVWPTQHKRLISRTNTAPWTLWRAQSRPELDHQELINLIHLSITSDSSRKLSAGTTDAKMWNHSHLPKLGFYINHCYTESVQLGASGWFRYWNDRPELLRSRRVWCWSSFDDFNIRRAAFVTSNTGQSYVLKDCAPSWNKETPFRIIQVRLKLITVNSNKRFFPWNNFGITALCEGFSGS